MKKLIKISLFLLFTSTVFAVPSTVNIINATSGHTLYYNVILAAKTNCYPKITASKVTGSINYLTLGAGASLSFNTFNQLSSLYSGGLNFRRQISATTTVNAGLANANSYCTSIYNSLQMNWAGFIYKVQNSTGTEGAWMRFNDFSTSCIGGSDYVSYTYTEAYTTYTIGGARYFVVSDL